MCAGGQDTGEDVGMSKEVGRMQVWARRVEMSEDAGMQMGRMLGKMWV